MDYHLILLIVAYLVGHSLGRTASVRNNFGNFVAVANRAGGTVSLVDPASFASTNFSLPDNGEPMYFAGLFFHALRPVELWIGDRANNRIVITALIRKRRRSRIIHIRSLPVPNGTFHSITTQDISDRRPKSFTVCDIDNVTIVHDIRSRRVHCLLTMPKRLLKLGAKPHDVTADKRFAFVTYVGSVNGFGYVASYRIGNCRLITFIKTARDPHVAIRPPGTLWIAAQGGEVLSRTVPQLKPLSADMSQTSPHGMFISYNRKNLYVTNIADGGSKAVVVYNTTTGTPRNCPQVDSTFAVPHNPSVSFDDKKLYLTHSLADDNVNSAWDIGNDGCVIPDSEQIFRTGNNPFGISVLPPRRHG